MQFVIYNNSVTNPQQLDLTNELSVVRGEGLDPASAAYSDKQFTHSLLREGGVYTLENPNMKEIIFPILVGTGQNLTSSQVAARIQQINQIVNTPGATASWQDDGMSQATYYTLNTGTLDVEYDFREQSGAHFARCKLRLFSQPFVTPASPRFYARASGIGPVLMVSPYASDGSYAVAASTQAGVAGFGGKPYGASTGIFYGGNPSLGGDAPTLLQISYTGPMTKGASLSSVIPYVAVSLLPDSNYQPLITASELDNNGGQWHNLAGAVASTYLTAQTPFSMFFQPFANSASAVPATWAGNHRMFVIARASVATASQPGLYPYLQSIPGPAVQNVVSATVTSWDWGLYDLGTFTLRASEPTPNVAVGWVMPNALTPPADVSAIITLPDYNTWFLNPQQINGTTYGWPLIISAGGAGLFASSNYSNTLLIDDTLPDQFVYAGQSITTFTPSPAVMNASSARITQFSRGVVPRPDPFRSIPILAFMGVGVGRISSTSYLNPTMGIGNGQWLNPQNLPQYAQINVLERARYILS